MSNLSCLKNRKVLQRCWIIFSTGKDDIIPKRNCEVILQQFTVSAPISWTKSQDFLPQVFFMNHLPPSPQNNIRVMNFFKNSRRYSQVYVHHWYQHYDLNGIPRGRGENWFMEKTWRRKSRGTVLLTPLISVLCWSFPGLRLKTKLFFVIIR